MFKFTFRLMFVAVIAMTSFVSARAQSTLIVDDDRAQCKNAQFQSINAAIAAAQPGDTIKVCAGRYAENVLVNKSVELLGARKGNAAAPGRQDKPEQESIVVNGGQGGFDVSASNVSIVGFTVEGNPALASYPNAGIYVRTGSKRVIESNVLRANGLGVYVEGAQQELDIERNAFLNNNRGINPAFQPAGGVFAAGGALNDTEISNNYFTGNDQFSINIGNGSERNLLIEHNEAVKDGVFLIIGRSTNTKVAYNKSTDSTDAGVLAFGDNTGLLIEHNSFERGGGTGIRFILNFGATQTNVNSVVRDNRVSESQTNGIRLDSATGSTVEDNKLENNKVDGIRLTGAINNRITKNIARNNGRDGIRAQDQSSGNTIESNILRDNVEFDAFDDTLGAGTAGTANFWIKNNCLTESRIGLCERPR